MSITSRIGIGHEALANIIKTHELSMDRNQRSYAWESENVRELFRDLQTAISDNEPEYFLGSIVITTTEHHVVDGQQRLATTIILLAAMRDFLLQNEDENRAVDIERDFLFRRDFRTQENIPRLMLNKKDHDFFQKRILSRPGDPGRNEEPAKNVDSHIRILEAQGEARKRVQQITDPYPPHLRAEHLSDWKDYLETKARVILISVPDDVNAYTIFETLNDRGVDLSISDLLKITIFNVAGDRLDEAETRWEAMTGTLESIGGEDLAKTYIRHLWVAMRGPTRERDLLSEIKKNLKGKQSAIDLATELSESAKLYLSILNPQHPLWMKNDKLQALISDLNVLGVAQVRPLMLSVLRRFSEDEIEASLRCLVSWSVRFLIYGGAGGGTLERNYGLRAESIWSGKIKTAKALADDMKSTVPGDVEFAGAFAVARVSRPHLGRFYLRALEIAALGEDPCMVPSEDKEVISLEHVLPQNPGSNWGKIDQPTAEAYYKRIGNMALLETEINNSSEVGNNGFDDKKPFLKSSPFKLTQQIAADYTDWGPSQIDDRQKRLASLAVKTWPLYP